MEKELIINAKPTEVEIALLEDGKLVELHHQKTNNNFSVGDIFLGRVIKLMPGLNAAFVDIGHKKEAFLHYTDLGPKLRSLIKFTNSAISGSLNTHLLDNFKLEPEIIKTGKIDQVLNRRQPLLVQVLKEPISTKGPRLSCEITIPGRYLVLTPFSDTIAVSKKIGSAEERKRLKNLIESIRPKNFGVIVRTAAEGKGVQELHEELSIMLGKWESIFKQLRGARPPVKLLSELDKTSSILRDILNDSFNRIVVNDQELFNNIRSFLSNIAPDKVDIVQLYTKGRPIFDAFGITKQIKSSFGKTATMPSGAYLVIESTEAMHVIDVNSGHKMSSQNQEQAVLNVNLEAAEEIARQLRLRDIGGLIIIDFIDMRNNEHKKMLYKAMRAAMKKDRAQHTILPLSKFGLMQITRQRVRPEVRINTAEQCPTCRGTGKVNPTILITDEIERDLAFIIQSNPKGKITLRVHPYIEAFLKRGFPSIQMKWFRKFFKWIRIVPDNDYALHQYKFFNDHEDEIRLN
ncbi:MAG: ribonuclease G [Saprospiraceae bacterium]|nr:MAG: ribonuclease G [Saprospiraceae bacterium]